jgi:hypothetical protein
VFARAVQACERRLLPLLVIGLLLAAVLLHAVHRQAFEVFSPFGEARSAGTLERVAAEVASRSRPDERIFFWGWQTDLYVLANRPPASRFVFVTFLTGWTPGGLKPAGEDRAGAGPATRLWLEDLTRYRPRLIIDGHRAQPWTRDYPLTRYPDVWRLIQSDYRVASVIEGYVIYERVAR